MQLQSQTVYESQWIGEFTVKHKSFPLNNHFQTVNNQDEYPNNTQDLPDVSKLTPEQCALDFKVRRQTRKQYPGACSLEFQNVMDIIIKSLMNWSTDDQVSMGPGMAGDITAWVQAAEEQGRGTLHAHWQLFTKQLSNDARAKLFHENTYIRNNARRELIDYIDNMICALDGSDIKLTHTCEKNIQPPGGIIRSDIHDNRAKAAAPKGTRFIQRHAQTFRDARHKVLCNQTEGQLIICNSCDGYIKSDDIVDNFIREKTAKKRVSNEPGTNQTHVIPYSHLFFYPIHRDSITN